MGKLKAKTRQLKVETLIEDTTVHGLKAACDKSYGIIRSTIWAISAYHSYVFIVYWWYSTLIS